MFLLREARSRLPSIVRLAIVAMRFIRRPSSVKLTGIRLELDEWATPEIRNSIYGGWFERDEHNIVIQTLRPDDVVLEVGAGTGYITAIAARIAHEVRSYDANPEVVSLARATLARNGLAARIENAVLMRQPSGATIDFYVHPDFWTSSLTPVDDARRVDVPVRNLDSELQGCSYMIVDIEGAETELLSSGLPGIRAICVETHPDVSGNHAISKMLATLFEHGFAIDVSLSLASVLYLARD